MIFFLSAQCASLQCLFWLHMFLLLDPAYTKKSVLEMLNEAVCSFIFYTYI